MRPFIMALGKFGCNAESVAIDAVDGSAGE
jgi:hypothetical protein